MCVSSLQTSDEFIMYLNVFLASLRRNFYCIKGKASEIHIIKQKIHKKYFPPERSLLYFRECFLLLKENVRTIKKSNFGIPSPPSPPLKENNIKFAKTPIPIKIGLFFSCNSSCYYLSFAIRKFRISHYNGL